MIDFKDRVPTKPNRFLITPEEGGTPYFATVNRYDEPVEPGTPLNKVTFDRIQKESGNASYMAFCTNANTDSLDAAFGKNNEDIIGSIGRQLAMYVWFKGKDKMANPYIALINKNTLDDIADDTEARNLILLDDVLLSLVMTSPYARTTLFGPERPVVLYDKGNEYLDISNGCSITSTGDIASKANNKLLVKGSATTASEILLSSKFVHKNFNRCIINVTDYDASVNRGQAQIQIYTNQIVSGIDFTSTGIKTHIVDLSNSTETSIIIRSAYDSNYYGKILGVDYIALYCE